MNPIARVAAVGVWGKLNGELALSVQEACKCTNCKVAVCFFYLRCPMYEHHAHCCFGMKSKSWADCEEWGRW